MGKRHSATYRVLLSLTALLLLAALSVAFAGTAASPAPITLDGSMGGPLGARSGYLIEPSSRMDIVQAYVAWRRGEFRAGRHAVESFGIGSTPVWMHLSLDNPGPSPLAYRIMVGTTWIDHVEVYVWRDNQVVNAWRSGDAVVGAPYVVPGAGFVFPATFAPGRSELFIRADTADPLLLPVELVPAAQAALHDVSMRYAYGVLYGFLLALIVYNAVLYIGLRRRSLLYYALYLLTFIAMHLAYTGDPVG